jgi:uncharacterized membrane protein
MNKGRLEAFTDGVIAVIITIMVLEMKVPHDVELSALSPVLPIFLTYVLSFIYVGIYWSNHHHMFHTVHRVDGVVLWANLNLLFWLSLIPFVTGWIGENHFHSTPVFAYGLVLLCSGLSYTLLTRSLLRIHEADSAFARGLGRDRKGYLSLVLYVVALAVAFWQPLLSCALYIAIACMWIVPDRRFEKLIVEK